MVGMGRERQREGAEFWNGGDQVLAERGMRHVRRRCRNPRLQLLAFALDRAEC